MKIGLIDVDSHNFPNLALMKISAYHKSQGDSVEWYEPLFSVVDRVYMSKVFTFTQEYEYPINAKEIIRGGTGYNLVNKLDYEIEHIYPDYTLYPNLTNNTAYGFLTRGCPRNCMFCIVGCKEGLISQKVADLSAFWKGQKEIKLLDPNLLACKDRNDLFQQLIDSKAWVDFTQGLDIRLMTDEIADLIKQAKVKRVHFAWDNYEDTKIIVAKLKEFKANTKWDKRKMAVYILCNFNTTFEQDLERVYTLRDLGYWPYVMIYNKDSLPKRHDLRRLQRWVNMKAIFEKVKRFEDYKG